MNRTITIRTLLVFCGFLVLWATIGWINGAYGASMLTMKQAKDETRRVAVIEMSGWDSYPTYTGLGVGPCSRKSRLRIRCHFDVYERLTSDGPQNPRDCEYKADVRLVRGKVRSTVERLGCERR